MFTFLYSIRLYIKSKLISSFIVHVLLINNKNILILYILFHYLGMELVGPSKRVWAGIVVAYFFAFGLVILAGLGYVIRHWMYLELAVSVPVVFFISYWW